MILEQAKRLQVKIKMALQGPSGSGKTLGALNIAYGLAGSWQKIVVIDTENHSASLYSNLGTFQVINLPPPFTPENYIRAIELAENSNCKVIILDSITHEWEELLEIHAGMMGNSFQNWGKITPRHNSFVQKILQSSCHVIATMRSKQDYVLTEKNGKQVPEKVGLKPVQRDGMDYDFTLVFDLDLKHKATCSKDRTGLYADQPEFTITAETGKKILDWCLQGEEPAERIIATTINTINSLEKLYAFYRQNPQLHTKYRLHFLARKAALLAHSSPVKH